MVQSCVTMEKLYLSLVIKLWANHFKTIGTLKCGENEAVSHARDNVPLLEEKSKTKEYLTQNSL